MEAPQTWDSKSNYIPSWRKERDRCVALQSGEGNSQKGERRKYMVNKDPAMQISLSTEKVIFGNSSLPGTTSNNVNFPYKG